ncbi:tyrosine-type recombinase/integrase [Methanotorris igneus]|uniref:Integrase family protein n=1 Tax=Methanotorris igneus (strain DSM 5666 / JCM 11834 / Kol 5) TaxID=880724 RepID=F6BBZ9_METIK|nr:tyrosine-type recombinase/integrase [Methanotorris igneus]AEF96080.1 integrase family protein [Methanotorris igneus Kol 5]
MGSEFNIKNLLLVKRKRDEIEETDEMRQWLERFKEEREFDGIKPSTIHNDLARLRVFLDFCYNRLGKSPDKLQTHDFVKFFNYLEVERKLSKNTQKRYYDLLKVFYRVLRMYPVIKGFVEESKDRKRFSRIEVKHYDPVDDRMLNLILERIIGSNSRVSIRNALIVRMLWDTGCRISEILNLKYRDCDFDSGVFRITDTKTHEERKVVCSEATLEALKWYVQFNVRQGPDDYIFQKQNGDKLSRDTITKVFNRVVKELKKEGKIPQNRRIVIHSLRHGRCVDLLEKGIPVDIVKEYLGHKTLDTTLFYSHSKERTEKLLKTIKKIL